jgi:hypothetical protein
MRVEYTRVLPTLCRNQCKVALGHSHNIDLNVKPVIADRIREHPGRRQIGAAAPAGPYPIPGRTLARGPSCWLSA